MHLMDPARGGGKRDSMNGGALEGVATTSSLNGRARITVQSKLTYFPLPNIPRTFIPFPPLYQHIDAIFDPVRLDCTRSSTNACAS